MRTTFPYIKMINSPNIAHQYPIILDFQVIYRLQSVISYFISSFSQLYQCVLQTSLKINTETDLILERTLFPVKSPSSQSWHESEIVFAIPAPPQTKSIPLSFIPETVVHIIPIEIKSWQKILFCQIRSKVPCS